VREPEVFVLADHAPLEDRLPGLTGRQPWRGETVEHVARTDG
jgi:hypothetical protein